MTALSQSRRLSGRAILLMLLAFFGVVLAVNAVFVAFALRSFTGLSTERPYQRGLEWNRELAAVAAQKSRGWSVSAEVVADGGEARILVSFADAAGRPLDGLTVRGELRRPASQGSDVAAPLAAEGDGRYGAAVTLPLRGQWDLRIEAQAADGAPYILEKRLWLP